MARLAIIIVNWNSGSLLAKCLRSLAHLPQAERELVSQVVVVDNASADRSVIQARVAAGELPVTWLILPENIGFAAANNRGIEALPEDSKDRDHLLLLNPDTEVHAGVLLACLDIFARHEEVGVVGPKLLNIDGSSQPSVRAFPTTAIFVTWFLKLTRFVTRFRFWRRYIQSDFDYGREQSADQVMGAAFCIRNEVYKRLGGLDEQFWIWFEEVDYCQRALAAGWKVMYTPRGSVTHVGGTSFDQLIGLKRVVPFVASSLRYARKYLSPASVVLLYLLSPVALLLALPASVFHLISRSKNKKRL